MKTSSKSKEKNVPRHGCSLCGRLYNSFAFKGGYICEDCLQSIKDPSPPVYSKKK